MKNKNDVITFLNAVKDSLYGDLENFDRLCKEAEEQEKYLKVDSDKIESHVTPRTTTTQTTSSGNFSKSGSIEEIKYRSTIPHMMAVFSTIDLVGFLLGNSKVKANSEIFITKFFEMLDIETYKSYKEQDIYKKLALIYRNGMAHSFFPKKKYGISADSRNPDILFYLDKDIEVLNAQYLIKLTKEVLENVLSKDSLIENMQFQFKELLKHDESKTKNLKNLS